MSRSLFLLGCAVLVGPATPTPRTPHLAPGATQELLTVRLTFVPDSARFAEAAREYERIWVVDGPRIVATMERVSGLRFVSPAYADTAIVAHVREVASYSGYRTSPMVLRASYPTDTKRATLVHELGHRLQSGLFRRDEEEHNPLFLWLYAVWVELYGAEFADAQVAVEKRRGPRYAAAWDGALVLSAAERASRWREILAERLPTRR